MNPYKLGSRIFISEKKKKKKNLHSFIHLYLFIEIDSFFLPTPLDIKFSKKNLRFHSQIPIMSAPKKQTTSEEPKKQETSEESKEVAEQSKFFF